MVLRKQDGRVTVQEGVAIGTGGGRALHVDVYTPPEATGDAPGLLLVHGGSWQHGDRSQLRGYGILLGRLGFVCVACEYRLSGEAPWPAQLHDVKTALRWMRGNAATLRIDPERIAVSGNSAGGHLALLLAGTANAPAFEGDGEHQGVPTHVAACVAFYAPAKLEGGPLTEAAAALFGGEATPETVRAASPITYAGPDFPPTLLVHGNEDTLVPATSSFAMYRALTRAGAPAELHVYNGAPHAFDAERDLGRQCADLVALFLDRHVVDPRPVVLPEATA